MWLWITETPAFYDCCVSMIKVVAVTLTQTQITRTMSKIYQSDIWVVGMRTIQKSDQCRPSSLYLNLNLMFLPYCYPLAIRFDAIVSADAFENLKPAPDIFLVASKILNVPTSEVYHQILQCHFFTDIACTRFFFLTFWVHQPKILNSAAQFYILQHIILAAYVLLFSGMKFVFSYKVLASLKMTLLARLAICRHLA